MTSTADTKVVYDSLHKHFDSSPYRDLPQRKEVKQTMELQYTLEQAELALSIPIDPDGLTSLPALAAKVGKDEAQVWSLMEGMLAMGSLYMQRNQETGEEEFRLWDWEYSLITPMWGDGIVTDAKRKIAALREQIWGAGLPYFLNPSSYSIRGHIMPYEGRLDPSAPFNDYESYSHYINKASAICVVACGCRMSVEGCRNPVFNCMHFNEQVEYWVKYRRSHELTKEEALELIEEQIKGGLVVTGQNSQLAPLVFCTCCAECCVILKPFIENHITNSIQKSNFLPQWDHEKCKVCKICSDACHPKAIGRHLSHVEGEKDHRIVMEERCYGCGVCSAVCPREAITMVRVRDHVPEEEMMQAGMKYWQAKVW